MDITLPRHLDIGAGYFFYRNYKLIMNSLKKFKLPFRVLFQNGGAAGKFATHNAWGWIYLIQEL